MTATTHCSPPSEAEAEILARASFYRLLSRLFADPAEGVRATAQEIDVARAGAELLCEIPLAEALARLRAAWPESDRSAREAFACVFGFLVGGPAPPYEAEYEDKTDIFHRTQFLADIAGFYRAWGLDFSRNDRPDHVTVEAGFLWYLLERHAAARANAHGAEKEEILASSFRSFFAEHFGAWTPSFAEHVRASAREKGSAYFEAASAVLETLLASERGRLNLPAPPPRAPRPDATASAAGCGGCAVGG